MAKPSKASSTYRPKPSGAELNEILKAPFLIRDNEGNTYGYHDRKSVFKMLEKLRAQHPHLKFKYEYTAPSLHVEWDGQKTQFSAY